jgi:hypothetical protein
MRHSVDSFRRSLLFRGSLTVAVVGVGALLMLRKDVVEPSRAVPSSDRMAAELVRAAERADICSAANAVGVGLRGEYFSEASLRGPAALVRVDDVVDFDPLMNWPSDIATRPVSVRWSGWVKPPLSGRYRFHAEAPNMQIRVARKLVAGAGAAPDEKVEMAAGRFYPIEVVVSQLTDSDMRIRLEWTAPHGARYVVPKALLHLPTEMVAAAPTSSGGR